MMAVSRTMSPVIRSLTRTPAAFHASRRHFSASSRLLSATEASLPVQKPLGAFRGGILGFLCGSTIAGGSAYYYAIKEFRLSNEMLTEDIYALQAATQRLNSYVSDLEARMDQLQRKK